VWLSGQVLKRLNLANSRRIWPELVDRAETEEWTYRAFLETLVGEEVAQRQRTRLARCTHQARFPFLKTVDDFDFQCQSQLRLALLGSYLGPDFVTEGRSLILYGQTAGGRLTWQWPSPTGRSRTASRRCSPLPRP